MPQTAKVAQTVETAAPQTRVTDTAQENASSLEHAQFQARMRGMNIPPNGSRASINQVVQRIEAGGQHPLQKHEDFMYLQRTIGNQAVIQLLDRMKAAETGDIHKTAAAGVPGTGSPLPHLNKIQQSFGQHDVSGVRTFTGSKAATASKAIGAEAYTTGNKIAFANPSPDLHTTAHEATHVLQQRTGVQLDGGVGEVGDSYERQADAVADKVVKGQSAAELLKHHPGVQRSHPLQRLGTERYRRHDIAQKDFDIQAQIEKQTEDINEPVSHSVIQKNNGVLQMRKTQEGYEKTDNDRYMIKIGERSTLNGTLNASDPKPDGLYNKRSVEINTDKMVSWKPNVSFVSSDERSKLMNDESQDGANTIVDRLVGKVSNLDEIEGTTPNLAIIGKNDCDIFATVLQNLIHSGTTAAGKADMVDTAYVDPDVKVGGKMQHFFPSTDEEAEYHAATVVAKDGTELVTLEANVGHDLIEPEFYVRTSVAGFVTDNDSIPESKETKKRGTKVTISEPSREENASFLGKAAEMFGSIEQKAEGLDIWLTRCVGASKLTPLQDLHDAVSGLIGDPGWENEGKGIIGTKIPSGIQKMRSALGKSDDKRLDLDAIQVIAEQRIAKPDKDRSKWTSETYLAMAKLKNLNRTFELTAKIKSLSNG